MIRRLIRSSLSPALTKAHPCSVPGLMTARRHSKITRKYHHKGFASVPERALHVREHLHTVANESVAEAGGRLRSIGRRYSYLIAEADPERHNARIALVPLN
jgi:hypothetical protein